MKLIRLTDEQINLLIDEIRFHIGVYQELDDEEGGYTEDVEFWQNLEKVIDAGQYFEEDLPGQERCPTCKCGPGDGITETCNDPVGCGFWKRLSENG